MIPVRDAIEHYVHTRQKGTQTVELGDPQSQVLSLKVYEKLLPSLGKLIASNTRR